MADLPDFYSFVETTLTKAINLTNGLDAAKAASPSVGDVYVATDTSIVYICFTAGTWTDFGALYLGAVLTLCEVEVFNGASPNPSAWTDLDLGGTIGANPAIVFLRLYNPFAGAARISTRPNGETEKIKSLLEYGAYGTAEFADTDFALVICLTDAAGIIEWYYTKANQAGTTIDLIGYVK